MLALLRSLEPFIYEVLRDVTAPWQSLYVDDEEPFVKRLFLRRADCQIALHEIPPCRGKPLLHLHTRPSAVLLVDVPGQYRHHIGWSEDRKPPPWHFLSVHELQTGDAYEMPDPCIWHAVEIIGPPILSINLTGPQKFPGVIERLKSHPLGPLSPGDTTELRQKFLERFTPSTHP